MSKGSQQQSITARDRAASAPSRSKQSTKGDSNGASNGASNGVKASAQEPAKSVVADHADEFGVVPTESAEDDFFARGEAAHSSLPPAALDLSAEHELDNGPEAVTLTPAQIERRARLRRIVGGVVGAAAVLTAVVGAKALAAPGKVMAAEGTLNVPHQVVASIAMPPARQEPQAAAPENAATAEIAAAEPAAPPAEQAAPSGEKVAGEEGAAAPAVQGADTAAKEPAAVQARRLPVIDIEIPASTDPTVDQQWASAAKNLSSKDFKGADTAFAELGKRSDLATRETARLARAAWWTANGRQNEVKPVIADLAANATTPSVRQQAHDLLSRAN